MLKLTFRPVTGRSALFDEIKGWGILLLLLYHAGGVLVWRNFLHGDLGTDVFLLISGLGLALNAQDLRPAEFFRRRLLRIVPGYWIVLTAYLILNQVYLQLHYSAGNVVAHYLGVHALFGDGWGFAVNDSFWFITAILLFYSCFLAMRGLLERPDRFLLVAAVLSTAGVLLLFSLGQSGLTGRWGFRMIDFFVGMLVGHALKRGTLQLPLTPALGLALLVILYVPYTQGIVFHPSVVALGLIAAYLLALRPWLARFAAGRATTTVLAKVGRYSLEIFLIHQPLMREYNRYLHGRWFNRGSPTDPELIMGIGLAIGVTFVLAVELQRFTRWLVQKLFAPRSAGPAIAPARELLEAGEPRFIPVRVTEGDPGAR